MIKTIRSDRPRYRLYNVHVLVILYSGWEAVSSDNMLPEKEISILTYQSENSSS